MILCSTVSFLKTSVPGADSPLLPVACPAKHRPIRHVLACARLNAPRRVRTKPQIMRKTRGDFPAPLGPSRPTISPSPTVRLTPSTDSPAARSFLPTDASRIGFPLAIHARWFSDAQPVSNGFGHRFGRITGAGRRRQGTHCTTRKISRPRHNLDLKNSGRILVGRGYESCDVDS